MIKDHVIDIFANTLKTPFTLLEEHVVADYARVDFFIPEHNLIIEVDGFNHKNGKQDPL
jgi:very-short-patch-repair endonuclease